MTSVLRYRAQIPRSIKYLIGTAGVVPSQDLSGALFSDASSAAFAVAEGTFGPADHIQDGLISAYDASATLISFGNGLHKDLGRKLYVYDSSDSLLCVFNQVQLVQGTFTEGVNLSTSIPYNVYYIKTWSSVSGTVNVYVARTGP